MRPRDAVAVRMVVAVSVMMMIGRNHAKMLYYNITSAKSLKSPTDSNRYDSPTSMATAAVGNGNGIEIAARNQTNRAGMNGISQSNIRWKVLPQPVRPQAGSHAGLRFGAAGHARKKGDSLRRRLFLSVIPGSAVGAETRHLKIPDLVLRTIPE